MQTLDQQQLTPTLGREPAPQPTCLRPNLETYPRSLPALAESNASGRHKAKKKMIWCMYKQNDFLWPLSIVWFYTRIDMGSPRRQTLRYKCKYTDVTIPVRDKFKGTHVRYPHARCSSPQILRWNGIVSAQNPSHTHFIFHCIICCVYVYRHGCHAACMEVWWQLLAVVLIQSHVGPGEQTL